MILFLNGSEQQVPDHFTLAQAVGLLGIERVAGVAVAVGAEVVPATEWASRTLSAGERVEVLRAVQGG